MTLFGSIEDIKFESKKKLMAIPQEYNYVPKIGNRIGIVAIYPKLIILTN